MDLFDLAMPKQQSSSSARQSKKGGLSLGERIIEARRAVKESLGDYESQTETIITLEDLTSYFENTGEEIAIDTETMGQRGSIT